MAKINVLDSDTINKIAAGEVVERPASVVKELVENALDAGATAVTVEIRDGGTSFIRITDNGSGIPKEEVPKAFLRHATSKIKSVEDLLTVSSLGFRGEALSSISSVAQVELITKVSEALTGTRYCIEGNEEKAFEEIGCPEGTTFIIRNLFFNTPARKKFLKSNGTEAGYINDLVWRLSLSQPGVSFRFIANGQTKLHTSGSMSLKDIIYHVFGREIASQLLEIDYEKNGIKLSGYVAKPAIARGNRVYENYFINGRYIKSSIVTKAIEDAYKSFMMVHKYPFTALHLSIDASIIDVNVHPQKMDIRFNENEMVYNLIYDGVLAALRGKELIPQVGLGQNEKAKQPSLAKAPEPFERNRHLKEGLPYGEKSNVSGGLSSSNTDKINNNSYSLSSQETVLKKQVDTPSPSLTHDLDRINASDKQDVIRAADQESLAGKFIPEDNPGQLSGSNTGIESNIAGSSIASDTIHHISELKPAIEPLPGKPDTQTVDPSSTSPLFVQQESDINTLPKQRPEQMTLFNDKLLSKNARLRHRLIGQVFETYWLVEYDGRLFIIDQHAAHEKVLYERLVHSIQTKQQQSQFIAPPIILTLTLREEEILRKYLDRINDMGFEIEHFGGREYAIRAIPAELYGLDEKEMLMDFIDQLVTDIQNVAVEALDHRLATMACKAAVKGNQRISFKEADALIDDLLKAENPYNCPHGRPTIISMTQYELEKKFKRIQT